MDAPLWKEDNSLLDVLVNDDARWPIKRSSMNRSERDRESTLNPYRKESENYKDVLRPGYAGDDFREIGDKFQLTRSVCQIKEKAIRRLRLGLPEQAIEKLPGLTFSTILSHALV